jgi:ferrous iron transport protein B
MKIALLGNPNTGKSSVFNMLTGLRQQVGNFPGVTVDKKFGVFNLSNEDHTLIDFPGTYSIYPRSKDEQVVYDVLKNDQHPDYPELAIVVADESNLERNLFLFTQVYDLQIPVILVLNMADLAKKNGKSINIPALEEAFPGAKIVETTARVGMGKERLLQAIQSISKEKHTERFYANARICDLDDSKGQETEATERYGLINEY